MTEYIAFDETELSQGIKELIARERSEERRATVERIRAAVENDVLRTHPRSKADVLGLVLVILDEEAQR